MKLLVFDCDSTLSAIEGVDEMARLRGEAIFAEVAELTTQAMNGEIPIQSIFARRLALIRPDRALCTQIGALYLQHLAPGIEETLRVTRQAGWSPLILSGGFRQAIEPLAAALQIEAIEAVPLHFTPTGAYQGFDPSYPTTRNGGKPELIRQLRTRLQPSQIVMVGDGVSDWETSPEVDLFVGFGGFTARPAVKEKSEAFIHSFGELPPLLERLPLAPAR
ncbi:MAG: HAD-IB family phosphatase [Verrucomicrobiota bacterium]